jgi:hypothetical protein
MGDCIRQSVIFESVNVVLLGTLCESNDLRFTFERQ